ncbi:MAG: conserved rane protein of unknown function [Blastococcus sp.]|nr:conserved rane protein of unknown function [Blastococcus sp.]
MSSAALVPALPARAHHLPAVGLGAGAVVLLVALPVVLGDVGRLAAVLVLQLGLVLAWVLATGIQGFVGSLAVGVAAAVAADLVLVLPGRPELGGLLAVFGVGFLAAVLQQMFRRPRPDLVASLAGSVLLVCVVAALAVLLLVGRSPSGSGRALVALLAIGAAMVVGHLVDLLLPRPQLAAGVPRGLLALVLAVAAGAAVGFLGRAAGEVSDGLVAVGYGAVLGGVAGFAGLVTSYVVVDAGAGQLADARQQQGTVGGDEDRVLPWSLSVIQAVLPIAACAPVALAMQSML